jgi:catalase
MGGMFPIRCYSGTVIANKLKLGVQIIDEDQQLAFGFDVLDDTKFIPEEIVPITPLGVMTLNANPQNYFAETEQIGVSQVSY